LSVDFFRQANSATSELADQEFPIYLWNAAGNGCDTHAYISSKKLALNECAIIRSVAMCAIVDGHVGVM
jgi:hypothetical protein